MLHRSRNIGTGSRQGLSVRGDLVLERCAIGGNGAFSHDGTTDDDRRASGLGIGGLQCCTDLIDRLAVDSEDVPAPSPVFRRNILRIDLFDLRRELDIVRIVVHDEIRQAQMAGDTAYALRNLLLHGTVRDVGVDLVRLPLAEAGRHETLGNRGTQCHGVPLPQRAGGIFDPVSHIDLGVTGCDAAPLAERCQILHRIVSGQGQHRIEHRGHVSGIEEETVAERIAQIIGIVTQELRIEDIDEIGAAHCTSGMARFGLLDHRRGQYTDVVGRTHQFCIVCHIFNLFSSFLCGTKIQNYFIRPFSARQNLPFLSFS